MRRPPYGSIHVQEMLDIIMIAAVFDQEIRLVFLDDGVYQLKKGQNPERSKLKHTAPIFQALELYDVNKLFVEQESLEARGMDENDLFLDVTVMSREGIAELLADDAIFFNS
jgi:tRNA 2-thiouridine synthesizing protein C